MSLLKKKDKNVLFVASFEDTSIIRKFTILFLLASILPLVLLYYIYYQGQKSGHEYITQSAFTFVMVLIAIGVFVGYMSMRSLMIRIIEIVNGNRMALQSFLTPETIKELNQEQNEIVVLSRSFSAVTKQLEENIRSLEAAKKTLHTVMLKVGDGISNMDNIDKFLQLILETMTSALNGKVGTLMIYHAKRGEVTLQAVYGGSLVHNHHVHIKVEGTPLAAIIQDKKPRVISGVFMRQIQQTQLNQFFTDSLLCAPLVYRDRVCGIMTLGREADQDQDFTEEEVNLLFNLASQTAVAIENAELNRNIEKTYFETISALALAVDAKDQYSRGHLDRVADYVQLIGRNLGLDEGDLRTLRDAARLHDIGKIGIPDQILRKEGSLIDEEWVIMRQHPQIGESIIKPVRSLEHLCDLIRHHHEKLDGSGYPDQLKGDEISPLVRILTVADIYDALTTERPYRSKKTRQEAEAIMRSMRNELDQDVIDVFFDALKSYQPQQFS